MLLKKKLPDNYVEMQVVQPSKSPWASSVVLVQKKDGSHRICIAYRGLNDVAKADNYPFHILMTSWMGLARLSSFQPLIKHLDLSIQIHRRRQHFRPLEIQSHTIWPEECSTHFPETYAASFVGC